jgi:hypothetical protein
LRLAISCSVSEGVVFSWVAMAYVLS